VKGSETKSVWGFEEPLRYSPPRRDNLRDEALSMQIDPSWSVRAYTKRVC